jgi:hypothetical protein
VSVLRKKDPSALSLSVMMTCKTISTGKLVHRLTTSKLTRQTWFWTSIYLSIYIPIYLPTIYIPTYLPINGSTALCSTSVAFSVSLCYTQTVELLGRGNRRSQGRYLHTEPHKQRIKAQSHPCLKWDSKPRSQGSSERRQFIL